MNLTNEQIEQILDGAPEGMSQARARHELRGGVCYSNSPHGDEPINLNHALSDLREILALRKRVQELEIVIKQSLDGIEYASFNLCETTVDLASRYKGRVVESTCPETSLLIAIRDMKEALTPPKGNKL